MREHNARSETTFEPEAGTNLVPAFERQPAPGSEPGPISQMISRALSLRPRGAVGNDGLVVQELSARLRVQLLARPIHPWDRDRPANERGELFVQQCLEDVSTAIPKLFRSMPEIDELEVTVFDPRGKSTIIAGIVKKNDALNSDNCFSAGMKLRAMGLTYGRSNSGFERMDENAVMILNPRAHASKRSTSPE
ncbi:MAG TPA: hypothetical protein VGP19_05625 [Candidatus Acidoferrales bacterium]|jgi:hypothetical protein|nr:hypothetical protein [Candidatus Acidoferrales bacterium]